MKINNCRNCKNNKFYDLFSLGKLSYTGKFPKNKKINIPKEEIKLIMCLNCKLIQISKNFGFPAPWKAANDLPYTAVVQQFRNPKFLGARRIINDCKISQAAFTNAINEFFRNARETESTNQHRVAIGNSVERILDRFHFFLLHKNCHPQLTRA